MPVPVGLTTLIMDILRRNIYGIDRQRADKIEFVRSKEIPQN